MKNENGYIDIDFNAVFIALLTVGILIGLAANELIEWVWPYIKAWIHAATE